MPPDLHEARTSALLAEIANGGRVDEVHYDELLERFNRRAFGVLLLLATLPSFIPLPVGVGAISGPLVSLVGLQLLFARRQPWVPQALRRRGIARNTFRRFITRMLPWLQRLERLSRPRLEVLTEHGPAYVFTGLQLVLLGVLLTLPIPFTNYAFGVLLLLFCFALIERDGALMLVAWVLGAVAIAASALLSGEVVQLLQRLIG